MFSPLISRHPVGWVPYMPSLGYGWRRTDNEKQLPQRIAEQNSNPSVFASKPGLLLAYAFPVLNTMHQHTDGRNPFENSNSISRQLRQCPSYIPYSKKASLFWYNFYQTRISLPRLSNLEIIKNNLKQNYIQMAKQDQIFKMNVAGINS